MNIQIKEFLELEAFKRLRSSSAKNQLNANSHNSKQIIFDVLIVIKDVSDSDSKENSNLFC